MKNLTNIIEQFLGGDESEMFSKNRYKNEKNGLRKIKPGKADRVMRMREDQVR